ncbi:MAG TPA: PEP-CTERM sorting domain-containing protein [Terriglobales bacterium]|nr:PEP-CTERM sorting domain-containing protein [Terriglobales bacterium]
MKLRVVLLGLLLCAAPAFAGEVYNNGPINGTTDGWTINFGFVVTDTFTVSTGPTTLGSLAFGAWLFPGDVLESVQVSVTSEAFGGTTYFNGIVNFTQSGCSGNQYAYNVCTETGFFNGPTLTNGTYWLELQNAVVSNGDPIYWDENSGVGCTSPGCPSVAQNNNCISNGEIGCIPSESFTLDSSGASTVPEPGSLVLFGSGFFGIVGIMRRRSR